MRLTNFFLGKNGSQTDLVYSRGRSKFVAPSHRIIGLSENEWHPQYVTPGTRTPKQDARATWGTLQKMVFDVVNASQSDEVHTPKNTPSGSTSGFEEASGSEEESGSESSHSTGSNEATASSSGSLGATNLEVLACHASSEQDHSQSLLRHPRMMSLTDS